MGSKSRRKGRKAELEIVHRHEGGSGFAGIDVPCKRAQPTGEADSKETPDLLVGECLTAESKARAGGAGFTTIERWLGDHDLLFLRRDRKEPLVVMPWKVYASIILHWYESGACTTWAPEHTEGEPQ